MNLIVNLIVLVVGFKLINAEVFRNPQRKSLRPVYFRACPVPRLKNGDVRLRQRGRLVVFKCHPPYILIGDRYSSCIAGRWDSPTPMCIKNGCPEIKIPPNAVVYPQYENATLTLFCHTGYQRVGSARTYCDGFEWDRPLGTCKEISTLPEPACDFETDDMCGWTQDVNHDFDWKRTNGMLFGKLLPIGPSYDHTIQKPLAGFYMFLDMKDGDAGDKARIVSPSYNQNKSIDACFRLFYHMYGISPGKLNVYAKPLSVDVVDAVQNEIYKRFEVNGNQKNLWKEGFFTLPVFNEEFQIIIEGVATAGHSSHIAIDDVALLNGEDCKSHINDNGTQEEKGPIGTQTCLNRCEETETTLVGGLSDYILLPNITVIKKCDCFYGCEDIDTCCLDYKAICGSVDTTPMENYETEITTEKIVASPSTVKTTSSTASTTKLSSTSTTRNSSTTARTTRSTTVKTTARVTTTPRPVTTTKSRSSTERTTTTQNPTTKSTTITRSTTVKPETDYIADVSPIGYDEDYTDEDINLLPPKRTQEYRFPDNESGSQINLLSIFVVAFIGFGLIISAAGGVYYYRRKKFDPRNYKEKANKTGNEQASDEFSEVRYLTCDEQLDFALQTPRELNS